MGTWSHEPLGNDSANDRACQLVESPGFSLVESPLRVASSMLALQSAVTA